MNTKTKLALLTIAFIPFVLFAQDGATPPAEMGALVALIIGLTQQYPVVSTILIVIGILRLTVKPILAIVEVIVKETPGTNDDEQLAKFKAGPIWRWILWALDLFASVRPPNRNTNPLLK